MTDQRGFARVGLFLPLPVAVRLTAERPAARRSSERAVWLARESPRYLAENRWATLISSNVVILHKDHLAAPAALRRYPRLATVCDRITRYRTTIDTLVANQPLLDDAISRHAIFANATRRDFLHTIAGIPYEGDTLEIATERAAISRFALSGKPSLTIGNGYDKYDYVMTSFGGAATKCYPHFGTVLAELKAAFPGLLTVQLGDPTAEPIAGVDLKLINRTSILEAAEILRHSKLHLDIDGGLVHLARCFGVAGCVIFGPTPSRYVGYPDNLNIAPTFCGGCWWVNLTWMAKCARGFTTARCMTEQDPRSVAHVAKRYPEQKLLPAEPALAVTVPAE